MTVENLFENVPTIEEVIDATHEIALQKRNLEKLRWRREHRQQLKEYNQRPHVKEARRRYKVERLLAEKGEQQ